MTTPTVVDLRVMRAAGTPWRAAHELVTSSDHVRMFRSVLLHRSVADDPDARARAVALILPAGAAVCGETAAWLHGIDARPPGRHHAPPRLQCIVPTGTVRRRRPGLACREGVLPADDVVMVHGVPTTSPARTALDLARYAPAFVGLASLDAFAHVGLVTPQELHTRARELRGARNIARARQVLELCEPATESPGESWLRLRLFQAGLPRPVPQVSIRDATGREVYRLDLGYPSQRVGIEYDGEAHHFATAAQQQADAHRREDLWRRFGWSVVGAHRGDVLGARNHLERAVADMLGHEGPVLARQAW